MFCILFLGGGVVHATINGKYCEIICHHMAFGTLTFDSSMQSHNMSELCDVIEDAAVNGLC